MTRPDQGAEGCTAHARIPDELRALAELFGDRLQPWLERTARDGAAEPAAPSCTCCPVCALIATLRSTRPDLVIRLAEHTTGLIAAARELLTPPAEPAEDADGARAHPAGRVSVQHIVVRAAADKDSAAGC